MKLYENKAHTAYMFWSAKGYPAPAFGVSFRRKELLDRYYRDFGYQAKEVGYFVRKIQFRAAVQS